jgi:7,8-dihydropterin-6-yl-methyl-4-(beta-D-ribofuranosyl)aminobenzene 5'-phosphate synthase
MKITTLIENKSGDKEDLYTEHGLSVYIEVDGKNILFDTGQSGNFIDNADRLDIDLKNLDYVIISHGHCDHSGGFERLIKEINPDIKLYLGNGFFDKKYNLRQSGEYEYLGNPFDKSFLKKNNIYTQYINDDITNVTESLLIFTNFNRKEEYENINQSMYIKEDDKYKKDMFLDEISIGIKTDKGLVVIVGCSHVGIVNILDTIIQRTRMKIYALIGGTHLITEDEEKIDILIEYLKEKDVKLIGACHCTGKQGETMLSQQLEENFINNNTGDVLKV